MSEYLFVYGTLRKHTSHQDLLQQYCQFCANGTLRGRLYQISHYPGAVLSDDPGHQVIGEIYFIRQPELLFPLLDDYEECSSSFTQPYEYVRTREIIQLEEGANIIAWTYLYNRSITDLKLIASGDFLNP